MGWTIGSGRSREGGSVIGFAWRNGRALFAVLAEKKALLALALSMGGKIRDLVKSFDEQMVNISSISVDTELSNVKVISRWKNMELGTCHVLMKMKVDNEIISRNIQQSDQIKESEQDKEKEP